MKQLEKFQRQDVASLADAWIETIIVAIIIVIDIGRVPRGRVD